MSSAFKDEYESSVAIDVKNATYYVNTKCGELHLQWTIDKYWGQLIHNVTLPSATYIYNYLVNNNYTIDNKYCHYNDTLYFIPTNNGKKVWVHKTGSVDFLLIISEDNNKTFDRSRFDARRIFRNRSEYDYYSDEELIGTIDKALESADTLMEMASNESRRHDLEFYRSIDWQIPCQDINKHVYGDGRDSGYIFSYEIQKDIESQRVESSTSSYGLLKHVTDIIGWTTEQIKDQEET